MILSPSLSCRDHPSDPPLDDLVRRSRDGDLDSFDILVGRYYRMVFGMSCRMLGNRETAEDATQEIFIKAWRNLARFRNASRFTTWLHSIALRHCLDMSRKQSRESLRREEMPYAAEESPDSSPTRLGADRGNAPGWDDCLAIQDAIERLPEKQRVVVILHYLLGHSVEEIARALSLSPNAIYARLNGSLNRLKKDLGDLEVRL